MVFQWVLTSKGLNMTLTIIRGIPGSGKSTYATYLNGEHVESDMYFLKEGKYKFDGSKIKAAHQWCRNTVQKLLAEGTDVVVSNTFTQLWEMKAYLDMAKNFNVPVKVIKVIGNFQNIHGVPDHVLEKMKARWQDYPGEEIVINSKKE